MVNLTSVLEELEQERRKLSVQLEGLNHALAILSGRSNRRTRATTISAAGRARIAAAQRARWTKIRGKKVVSIGGRQKRKISPAARKKS